MELPDNHGILFKTILILITLNKKRNQAKYIHIFYFFNVLGVLIKYWFFMQIKSYSCKLIQMNILND